MDQPRSGLQPSTICSNDESKRLVYGWLEDFLLNRPGARFGIGLTEGRSERKSASAALPVKVAILHERGNSVPSHSGDGNH